MDGIRSSSIADMDTAEPTESGTDLPSVQLRRMAALSRSGSTSPRIPTTDQVLPPVSERVREAVAAALEESPVPLATRTLQSWFAPRHRQRVYTQLRWLEEHGLVRIFRGQSMACWWTANSPLPRCSTGCGAKSVDWVPASLDADGEPRPGAGGWVCAKGGCRMTVWQAAFHT